MRKLLNCVSELGNTSWSYTYFFSIKTVRSKGVFQVTLSFIVLNDFFNSILYWTHFHTFATEHHMYAEVGPIPQIAEIIKPLQMGWAMWA